MRFRRNLLSAAVVLIVFALAACSQPITTEQSPDVQASAQSPSTGSEATSALTETVVTTNTPALTVPMTGTMEGMSHGGLTNSDAPFDAQFIDSMIEHHRGAIAMAEMALEQAEHDELVAMAEAIIAAQDGEIAQMEAWRAEWYPNIPTSEGMGMSMGDMALSEDANIPFDRRFLESMISHHRGAIIMAEAAQTMGEHAEIRALADAIIAAQESEIAQMHAWINDWYSQQGQGSEVDPEPSGMIWVANEEGNSLTVIDASTQAVVTTLTGIEGPHNVQVVPDGRTVWAISGHDALAVAIDAQNYSLLGTVPVGNAPAHVIVSPDGGTVWVSNSGDNTVTVIDTGTFTEVVTIAVGDFPHGLRPSPDGQWVAVANMRDNTVSLIDTAKLAVDATIEVGAGPVQVAFAPDGLSLYVTLNGEDAVARIDLATRSVVGKTTVGSGPVQVYVTPDARMVLVANQGTEESPGTTLSFVDAGDMVETGAVETGQGAHGVVIEPSGRYAYVTNLYGGDMAVVDLEKRALVATVQTGKSPNGVSFSPLKPADGAAEIVLPIPSQDGTEGSSEDETEDHEEHH